MFSTEQCILVPNQAVFYTMPAGQFFPGQFSYKNCATLEYCIQRFCCTKPGYVYCHYGI